MRLFLQCAQLLATGFLSIAVPMPAKAQVPGEYRVEDGKVDAGTFAGWRLFHSSCHGCHGVDAMGTDVAPNLLDKVGLLTPRAFVTKVLTSYRIVTLYSDTSSTESANSRESMINDVLQPGRKGRARVVMPAWEGDPTVNPHVLDLFAYLSARADGKLGVGKPKLLVDK